MINNFSIFSQYIIWFYTYIIISLGQSLKSTNESSIREKERNTFTGELKDLSKRITMSLLHCLKSRKF